MKSLKPFFAHFDGVHFYGTAAGGTYYAFADILSKETAVPFKDCLLAVINTVICDQVPDHADLLDALTGSQLDFIERLYDAYHA